MNNAASQLTESQVKLKNSLSLTKSLSLLVSRHILDLNRMIPFSSLLALSWWPNNRPIMTHRAKGMLTRLLFPSGRQQAIVVSVAWGILSPPVFSRRVPPTKTAGLCRPGPPFLSCIFPSSFPTTQKTRRWLSCWDIVYFVMPTFRHRNFQSTKKFVQTIGSATCALAN